MVSLDSFSYSGIEALFLTRYAFASGTTWLIWDILTTIDDEVEYVWSRASQHWPTMVVYALSRYSVSITLGLMLYVTSGISPGLTEEKCHIIVPISTFATTASSMLINGYMSYYYVKLWDHKKHAMQAMTAVFSMTYIPAVTITIISASAFPMFVHYEPPFRSCILTQQPTLFRALWPFLMFFDLSALILVILNALDRPRRTDKDMIRALLDDGIIYFLSLFALRISNTVCAFVIAPPNESIYLFHIWALLVIVFSRFVFRVERKKRQRQARAFVWDAAVEVFEMQVF